MHWLQSVDVSLFRFVNQGLGNSVFDIVMPFITGNSVSFPLFRAGLVIAAFLLVWKGGLRGTICLLVGLLALALGDGAISNLIKHAVARERPFLALTGVHCLIGKSGSGSMPSAHATNWFAATMVGLIYYRRSLWFMLPAAFLVGFSRVYNGVHYPSDVLAGAMLGAGTAAATAWLLDSLWVWAGQKWFPLWWERVPSLLAPPRGGGLATKDFMPAPRPAVRGIAPAGFKAPHVSLDAHWTRLGYLFIALVLLARLAYIASGAIQLAEDEAYQWLWSKHLALSYFSKPPLIAYTQFLGTRLFGDTAFGVRFFSPVIAAIISVLLLRFFNRHVNARAGFFLILILSATPLLAAGSLLMTIDPLSVLFWTAAMLAGWRAVQQRGAARDWFWAGLWMGLGFLSKYTALFQIASWALFFALWPPARKHLRRPGPYVALLVNLVCALPVLIWNAQHRWITVAHVADDAGVGHPRELTLRYLFDFLGSEAALLNPVFFVAMVWASIVFWRRNRHDARLLYFFSMGAPVFFAYLLLSFFSRVLPNWIAPAVVPWFCLLVIYWDTRWRLGGSALTPRLFKGALGLGLGLGFSMVILGSQTDLLQKLTGRYLPVNRDPLHRVREWNTTARVVGQAREQLLAEGKPVFIVADHYGMTGEISFYLPEAKAEVQEEPLVYCRSSATPENQFYFWPGYNARKGQNAIYVRELNRENPQPWPPPARLLAEFESVTPLGISNVLYHGQFLLRPLQLFACRGLR